MARSCKHWTWTTLTTSSIVVGLLGAGCQTTKQAPVSQTSEVPADQRARAGTPGITLFGEVDGDLAAPFVARATRSLQQHTFTPEGRDFDPHIDRTGRLMVFASTRHTQRAGIYLKSVSGSTVTQLTAEAASDVQPQFNPDAQQIAFASDRTGNWDIWLMNLQGGELTQVTSNRGQEIHPSWSPDGNRLVFCTLPESGGEWELWYVNLSQPGTRKFIGYGLFPEWSPTEDKILFQRARQRGSRWFSVWTITLTNGEAGPPTEVASSADYALVSPSWSPDGSQIAFCALTPSGTAPEQLDPTGQSDLWLVDADGKGRIRLTSEKTGNYSPVWSADGRVYFTSSRTGQETVWSLLPIQDPALTRDTGLLSGTQLGMRR